MKATAVLVALFFFGCGGSLSDEQRKEMREKMEMNRIVRVTEAEITEAAFEEGREIVRALQHLASDSARLDSALKINPRRIRFLKPGEENARMLEQQLIEAYLADPTGTFQDNVQEKRNHTGGYDSLLYTKPLTRKLPDGRDQLVGVWNIWLSRKELVLNIAKRK